MLFVDKYENDYMTIADLTNWFKYLFKLPVAIAVLAVLMLIYWLITSGVLSKKKEQ